MTAIKQVIVIRTDLNMRKGKMCSQAAHASMKVFFDQMDESGDDCYEIGPSEYWNWKDVKSWIDGAFTKIVVGCSSEEELFSLKYDAMEAKLPNAVIQDSGATEFGGNPTYTALAIGPANAEDIDKITKHLKLL